MSLLVEIRKDFGSFRLDVSFQAEAGALTGVLGASGCGKSLTLKCVAGIEKPDQGHIELDGRVLFDSARRIDLPPQKRRVGYLFQHYALFPHMTVEQNVAVGVRDQRQRKETAARLLQALRLEDCRGKYPRQLSGGQQQRAALARILASEPEVLLLDEPFSALDSYLKWQVELELAQTLERFSGPVLFVTHDRDEVRRLCRQVCVLDQGRSQPLQPVETLFRAPRTLSACLLSGCRNVSRARPAGEGRVEALDWGITLAVDAPLPEGLSHVGIQAGSLRLAEGPGPNRLLCPVERAVEETASTVLLLRTPGGPRPEALLRLELDRVAWTALGQPAQLWVELPPQHLLPLTRN
ncbi:sulfate/molybdate ABC transporter ATP-binding protein [uncultured Intestinimonas sp.]|uniref:sulfate/molybdate ABC transporter ATP-binding protein n=1 Tax=uncultured Intestinimonas sp. TaxID=1689265 RepID=UPI0025FA2FA9|nr:ATP-binding cassette domain-containing protein [uncultured Intestinimonas sp.]